MNDLNEYLDIDKIISEELLVHIGYAHKGTEEEDKELLPALIIVWKYFNADWSEVEKYEN